MRLYTRARVVKSNAVEVSVPCLVESKSEDFMFLGNHLSVVRDLKADGTPEVGFTKVEGEEKWPRASNVEEDKEKLAKAEPEQEARTKELLLEAEQLHAQAKLVLKEAQEEAALILERTRSEAEVSCQKLREETMAQAHMEGHAKGLAQGLKEGTAKGKEEAERLVAEAQNTLKLAQKAAHEEWSKVDDTLLQLAFKVAERILQVHIQEHPDQLIQRIRALSLLPEEREGWKLHVSTADYQWLTGVKDKLDIPLLEDQTLSPGDCFLECSEGIFDARVEVQLQRCEQLLREELRHGRLAESN